MSVNWSPAHVPGKRLSLPQSGDNDRMTANPRKRSIEREVSNEIQLTPDALVNMLLLWNFAHNDTATAEDETFVSEYSDIEALCSETKMKWGREAGK